MVAINKKSELHDLGSDMRKVLTIVSDIVIGQKRIEARLQTLESDVSVVKEKLDQVIDHSISNYEVNKQQDKRLQRLEQTTNLPSLV